MYAEEVPVSFAAVEAELLNYAQKKMDDLIAANKAACPGCSGTVLAGDAADAIVDYVRDKVDDLIIMGTHGAKGIEKVMLGSVAERVLKRASCPVLVYNPYKGERGYKITAPISEAVQPV